MSNQPSILSFFSKHNANSKTEQTSISDEKPINSNLKCNNNDSSNSKSKQSKRQRIINSDSEANSDPEIKEKVQRISISPIKLAPKIEKILTTETKCNNDDLSNSKSARPKRQRIINSDSEGNSDPESKEKIRRISRSPIKLVSNIENIVTNETNVIQEEKKSDDYEITDVLLYNPAKKPYNIIKDACWRSNEKVPYIALARTFQAIGDISERLEKTRVLSNFFRSVIYLSKKDLVPSIYLCLNKVAPDYEGVELGMGESVIIDSLSQATDTSKVNIKNLLKVEGDFGNVAMKLKATQTFLRPPEKLSLVKVFNNLKEITKLSGKSVQKTKVTMIKNMLMSCRDCEMKFLVKGLLGNLRIGLALQTVLAALGQAVTLTPPGTECSHKIKDFEAWKPAIEKNTAIIKNAYCEYPNYDLMIDTIITQGIEELPNSCSITPGVPIKPMLAHPSKGVTEIFRRFDNVDFTCEYKYDGERAQIHINRDDKGNVKVQIFSRNQENNTTKYPDIVRMIKEVALNDNVNSCILDSEAVAWDRTTDSILPFQKLSTRKKKDVDEKDIMIQVCIYAFDILYFNGESLAKKSFRERREVLRKNFQETAGQFVFATSLDSIDTDEICSFLETSIRDKCEGLMIKTLDSNASYEISRRSHNWLKLKKDYMDNIGDSLDLVVIGASFGQGKRANKYGNFLLACYDPESGNYQSICKLGTGLSDAQLDEVYVSLQQVVIARPKPFYEMDSTCKMDVWFEPTHVWEIKAADLSISPTNKAALGLVDKDKGISLRFPRFLKIRDDKKPDMATTARQVAEMYRNQDNVQQDTNAFDEDEFY